MILLLSLPKFDNMKTMKSIFAVFLCLMVSLIIAKPLFAQSVDDFFPATVISSDEARLRLEAEREASPSAEELKKIEEIKKKDVTQPEQVDEKSEVFALFAQRPAQSPTITNFIAYAIQFSVIQGVPANTIFLILLLPLLATLIAFVRHVLGLPSIGLLVPIALSITLVATGITAGVVLLFAIILASTLARIILKKIRIMQLPKMALSMFLVSIFIIATLTATASAGILTVRQISIFPVLLLVLLSERIVALQIERSKEETIMITTITIFLGILGFFLLSSEFLREVVLLYPETILILIPINIAIGRYFGLRFTEFYRFSSIQRHASK